MKRMRYIVCIVLVCMLVATSVSTFAAEYSARGGGWIYDDGQKITFGFTLKYFNEPKEPLDEYWHGKFVYHNHETGEKFKGVVKGTCGISFDGKTIWFKAYNDEGDWIEVGVTDNGAELDSIEFLDSSFLGSSELFDEILQGGQIEVLTD